MMLLICSYSRKIIWLELLNRNNDPGVVVLPYLIAILRNEGKLVHIDAMHDFYLFRLSKNN